MHELLRMPFGLHSTAQAFQRFIDQVNKGLDLVLANMKDILVVTQSKEDHADHLLPLSEHLREHGVTISADEVITGETFT